MCQLKRLIADLQRKRPVVNKTRAELSTAVLEISNVKYAIGLV